MLFLFLFSVLFHFIFTIDSQCECTGAINTAWSSMRMESSLMVGHVSTEMWAYFPWQMMNMCLFGECRSVWSSEALVSADGLQILTSFSH